MKLFARKGLYVLGVGLLIAGVAAFQLGAFTSDVVRADGCAVSRYLVGGVPNPNGGFTWMDVTVPAGCTKAKIKVWGDGGNAYFTFNSGLVGLVDSANGGGGGYVLSELNVTPGETLRLIAGGQGYNFGEGGHYSYVWSMDRSQFMVVAPGGGGGAGAVAGYTQLGHGGAGGGYILGRKGSDGIAGSQVGGGGWGAAYSAGGSGGAGASPGQNGGSNFSLTGGNLGYYFAGSGGKGYGGGGGGGSSGSGYPNYVNGMGGGGGGGTAYTNPAYRDEVVHVAVGGNGRVPGGLADPDYYYGNYKTGYGALGGTSVAYPNHAGGSGLAVAVFGEDLTVAESLYPPGVGTQTYCRYSPNTSRAAKFALPSIPPGCDQPTAVCRVAFSDNASGDDYVCRYSCLGSEDDVYLFRGVCVGD